MMPRTRSQDTADYEALVPTGKELPKHASGALEPLSASKMGRVKTSRGHSRGMQVSMCSKSESSRKKKTNCKKENLQSKSEDQNSLRNTMRIPQLQFWSSGDLSQMPTASLKSLLIHPRCPKSSVAINMKME